MLWKHCRQSTGRPCVGLNGTVVSTPHSEHSVRVSVRDRPAAAGPVPVFSPLYFLELKSKEQRTIKIGGELYGEAGLYILEGGIESEGTTFGPKELLVAKDNSLCEFVLNTGSTIYFFGGEPFPEERFIYWNFVASTYERIEQAKQQWRDQQFALIPGETGFIPLPPENDHLRHRM